MTNERSEEIDLLSRVLEKAPKYTGGTRYRLRPEDVSEYEKWLARHPEFDAPRKHK